jgi:hypothetical protein
MTTLLSLTVIILLALTNSTTAGGRECREAFARQDYASALREWLPQAKERVSALESPRGFGLGPSLR